MRIYASYFVLTHYTRCARRNDTESNLWDGFPDLPKRWRNTSPPRRAHVFSASAERPQLGGLADVLEGLQPWLYPDLPFHSVQRIRLGSRLEFSLGNDFLKASGLSTSAWLCQQVGSNVLKVAGCCSHHKGGSTQHADRTAVKSVKAFSRSEM